MNNHESQGNQAMKFNRHQLEAHEATVEHSLRMIARVDTVLFIAGCAVSILGGMLGLACLIGN